MSKKEKGAAMDELDKALESLGKSLDSLKSAPTEDSARPPSWGRSAESLALWMVVVDAVHVVAVYRQGQIARKDDAPHA